MKVSILITTYNHEKYIRKALEGIALQTECPEFEIILCDDCSSDNTVGIATELLSFYPRVHIHRNEKNMGITKNYQQAFRRCSGEYIFVLEGDDYWTDPFKIKKITAFLDAHSDCVMCSHYFVRQQEDQPVFTQPVINTSTAYSIFECSELILDSGIISNFSTCCYRRSILENISEKTYETHSYEWMINISMAQFGRLARINEPMSVYRISSTGAWANKSIQQQLSGMIGIIDEYNQVLDYRYDEYFKKKKQLLQQELAATMHPVKSNESSRSKRSIRKLLHTIFKK